MQFIDLRAQYNNLQKEIKNSINRVLESGKYIMGPEVYQLEDELANFTNSSYCISTSNGTDALLIALMALGVKRGDEIITSSFTFASTISVITHLNAKPVFVDIDPRSYNINPDLIEDKINEKTVGIIAVDLYGQAADYDKINAIAKKHNLFVIEDGAQSFGAQYKGKRVCGLANISCTSFYPAKPLGCYGDGGACFTNDKNLADLMCEIRNHGQKNKYDHIRQGINGRLDTIQAAILLVKLKTFPKEIEQRQKIANRYNKYLKVYVKTPHIEPFNSSVHSLYTIQIEEREKIISTLTKEKIPTAINYPMPVYHQPAFASFYSPEFKSYLVEKIAKKVLSLPMCAYLTKEKQNRVIDKIIKLVKK